MTEEYHSTHFLQYKNTYLSMDKVLGQGKRGFVAGCPAGSPLGIQEAKAPNEQQTFSCRQLRWPFLTPKRLF
jgi:hypothetical protein